MGVLRCSYISTRQVYTVRSKEPADAGRRGKQQVSPLFLVIPVTQCNLPGPITTSNDFQAQGITCRRVCNR